jgi:outer membrane biosynthesis protein TonB
VTSSAAPRELSLRVPLAASALLHLVGAAAFLFSRTQQPAPMAPTYRVSLIAAPPGPRQIGVVQPKPAAPEPAPAAPAPVPLSRARPEPERMKAPGKTAPVRVPKAATPNAATASAKPGAEKGAAAKAPAAPTAGGGPVGGRGADVANVKVDGIEFPYPGYLDNVVRQIALRFKPARGGNLRADVAFLIRRDGSISGLRLQTRSGVFAFDTEAMGAVEAAAQARAFGPLPQGFSDDVLPVIFSFDPRLIR